MNQSFQTQNCLVGRRNLETEMFIDSRIHDSKSLFTFIHKLFVVLTLRCSQRIVEPVHVFHAQRTRSGSLLKRKEKMLLRLFGKHAMKVESLLKL